MTMRPGALRRILLGASLAGFAVAAVAATLLCGRILHTPLSVPEAGAWLHVAPGTPLRRLTNDLGERGVLQAPHVLSAYGRLSGEATRIQAGEYLIPYGSTPLTLLEQLVSGEVYLHQIIVVDGWRFEELVATLRDHDAVDAAELDPDTVMAELGKPEIHPEGQFFPDTYHFPRGTPALEILERAHAGLEERLDTAWSGHRPTGVLQNPYEALILASIIEKETALPEERRRIAGVFHRRLERGMRLQADPTVIYGLGGDFDGNLRRSDLATDTPYNTYTRAGLPPTPIALPGAGALSAAVDPEPGTALYFVATGQGDGSHYFSTTLEEHNAAVARYLQQISGPH